MFQEIKRCKLSRSEMKSIFGNCGDYIRRYRDELCLSQDYMASKLGISQSTYQKIETGVVNITKERLVEIAEILGKQIEDFVPSQIKELGGDDILVLKEIIKFQAKEIKELKRLLNEKSLFD